MSPDALSRHFRAHVEESLQKHALAEREVVQRGARLQEQLTYIADKAEEILQQAQQAGQLGTALRALQELRESTKLLAIACGELEGEGHKMEIAIQVNSDRVDKLVDQETQVRIAVCYLQRHAPHLLAGHMTLPTAIPDPQRRPELTNVPEGERATPSDFVEGN